MYTAELKRPVNESYQEVRREGLSLREHALSLHEPQRPLFAAGQLLTEQRDGTFLPVYVTPAPFHVHM